MSSAPAVSVVMATYNHAPYVAQAIHSVLEQSFGDLELLVADDGSTDSTREVVSRLADRRLAFFPHTENRGACAVTNELIERATGEYVAIINSDDSWAPDKLAFQVAFMAGHREYGATFARASFIDRDGAPMSRGDLPLGRVFEQENRSQGMWLRRFFEAGNCLCHPTLLIRRACYADVGLYDNRFRQLPDLDMWVRLAKRYQLFVSDRELASLRILPGENASGQTRGNSVRAMNEQYVIAAGFFDGMSTALLREAFSDLLVFKDPPSEIHCDIEKALLYLAPNRLFGPMYGVLGLHRLFHLLASKRHRPVLETDYRLDDRALQRLSAEVDAFSPIARLRSIPRPDLIREVVRRVRSRFRFSR